MKPKEISKQAQDKVLEKYQSDMDAGKGGISHGCKQEEQRGR